MSKINYNRNPKGTNQYILRSDEELQKIIDKHKNWTKKDFRGEGKLNPNKKNALLTRKETERPALKFYQTGKRVNIEKILQHSTSQSIKDFNDGNINLETLRNRSSTKKIRDEMTSKEKKDFDKNAYANLTDRQLEAARERNRKYREKLNEEK